MRRLIPLLALLAAAPASAQTIVIDPGHGGSDPGAVGCEGLQEAPAVLDVGQQMQGMLESTGLHVELTREDDRFVDLSPRAAFANGLNADLFVSIHSNANDGTPASGTETWIANSASSTSVSLAGLLQEEMIAAWMLPDRGVKRANFTVIASTHMPAALTELAFTNRCSPDAALLRDPAERTNIARAQARAVLRQLGRDPGSIGEPGTRTGALIGVVFEDIGVGLEDTTRRIPGASVHIDGEVMATSAAETGAFRLDLEPGTYEVEARADGFAPGSRSCEVTPGGETWCSVGLTRGDRGSTDAGVEPAPSDDAGVIVPTDGAVTEPGEADGGRSSATAGCSVGAARSAGGGVLWLALFGLWLTWRRATRARSVAHVAACALLASVAGCGGEAAPLEAPLGETETSTGTTSLELVARITEPFASISEERPIGAALVSPQIAPDGRRVAMSSPDLSLLYVADLADGTLESVAQGPRVGFRPLWTAGGARLRYRHAEQSATAVPHYVTVFDEDEAALEPRAASWTVRLDERHRVVLRSPSGRSRIVSPEGDRYLLPAVSPDERHVAFWGMTRGLFLHRIADGALIRLGEGGHPSFGPEGRWLVFDRTEDDGHQLTAGELWITDLNTADYRTAPLTDTPARIERQPSLAAGVVAFTTPEGVLAAQLMLPN